MVNSKTLAVLCAGFFVMDFDLLVMSTLLVPIAEDLGVSLGSVTLALTAYLLLFGLMQPMHGSLSDAFGPVRVMRVALVGMGLANLVAALAPSLELLIAGRAAAAAFAAALAPVTVAYVGHRVAAEHRQRTMAVVLSAGALGAASATLAAGLLADLVSWRPALGIVAVAAPLLAVVYGRMPDAAPAADRPGTLNRVGHVLGDPWLRFLLAFGLVEGAAMVGFINFFNAALQVRGDSVLLAGITTSTYGLAAVCGGVLVRALDTRLSGTVMFGSGTAVLFIGYLVASVNQSVATIVLACACSGVALAVGQAALQVWLLEAAAAEVRGTASALVASAVFTGAAVGTAAVGGLANAGDFGPLFTIAAAVTLPVVVVGTLARAQFGRSARRPGVTQAAGSPGATTSRRPREPLPTPGRHRRPPGRHRRRVQPVLIGPRSHRKSLPG
jgi:predicted MFS family arabinose efflux permease